MLPAASRQGYCGNTAQKWILEVRYLIKTNSTLSSQLSMRVIRTDTRRVFFTCGVINKKQYYSKWFVGVCEILVHTSSRERGERVRKCGWVRVFVYVVVCVREISLRCMRACEFLCDLGYLIGQNFGGQNCRKSDLVPKILSAEKFRPIMYFLWWTQWLYLGLGMCNRSAVSPHIEWEES